jgi:hypothetical protein
MDDFQILIKNDAGQWESVPVANASFEEADSVERPTEWRSSAGYTFRTVVDSYHGRKSVFIDRTPLSAGHFAPIGWTDQNNLVALDADARAVVLIPEGGGPKKNLFTMPWPKELATEDLPFGYGSVSMTRDGRRFVFALRRAQSDVWVIENFDPDVR